MVNKFTKSLIILTVVSLLIVAISLIAGFKYYNWSLWIVPVFFFSLTYLIVKFLEPKVKNQFFATNFSQATVFKLFMLIVFILLFRMFLDKNDWISFVGYSVANYIAFTALEIKHLLNLLRQ